MWKLTIVTGALGREKLVDDEFKVILSYKRSSWPASNTGDLVSKDQKWGRREEAGGGGG